MIDTNVEIRTYLLADTALAALVGTRIYAVGLPKSFTISQAVELNADGGGVGDWGSGSAAQPPMFDTSVVFRSYGVTKRAARETYRALFDALHALANYTTSGGTLIFSAQEELHGQDMIEPDGKWPFVLSRSTVSFRNA